MGMELDRRSLFRVGATVAGGGALAASGAGIPQAAQAALAERRLGRNGVSVGIVFGDPKVVNQHTQAVVDVPVQAEGGPRMAVTERVRPSAAEQIAGRDHRRRSRI